MYLLRDFRYHPTPVQLIIVGNSSRLAWLSRSLTQDGMPYKYCLCAPLVQAFSHTSARWRPRVGGTWGRREGASTGE